MKRPFVIFSIVALAFASCKKTDVAPTLQKPTINNVTNAAKDTTVAVAQIKNATSAKGGPGGGGSGSGGGNTGSSNLDIYIKQLTGSWLTVVGISGTTGTIFMTITFKAGGTFSLVATNNVTGGKKTSSGNWQFTIPANLPIDESGFLAMTSGGSTVMSGLLYFVHPGIIEYQTPVNNLDNSLKSTGYVFQKT